MTDGNQDLRTRIAAAQREHRLVTRMIGRKAEKSCLCGWRSPEWDCTFTDHPEHVADAVIAALNLTTPVDYLSVDGELRHFRVAGHYTVEVGE